MSHQQHNITRCNLAKNYRRLSFLTQTVLVLLFIINSHAFSQPATQNHNVIIQPARVFQYCSKLQENSVHSLNFSASEPLLFSFYYREKQATHMLIAEHLTPKMEQARLGIKATHNYCLTWKNPQQTAVKLNWQMGVDEK